jgi:hypothetical protein
MITLIALAISQVGALRLAILSDVHLDTRVSYDCGFPICKDNGYYQEDSVQTLLETMVDDMVA